MENEIKQLEENLKTNLHLAQLHLAQDWGYKPVIFNIARALKLARQLKSIQRKNFNKK